MSVIIVVSPIKAFQGGCQEQAADIIQKLYNLFRKSDATLVEINPMAEDVNGDGKHSCDKV